MSTELTAQRVEQTSARGRARPVRLVSQTGASGRARFWVAVWGIRAGIVAALLGTWQIVGGQSPAQRLLFSTPSDVLATLGHWAVGSAFWQDLKITLTEAVLGYLVGVVAAVLLAALVFAFPLLERFLRPYITILNAPPRACLGWISARSELWQSFVAREFRWDL